MLVELGGGTRPHPRADVIIDLHHPKGCHAQDAAVTPWTRWVPGWDGDPGGPIPLGIECADEIYASHFMEHIPRGAPLIAVMNEAWRVLKPGGTFTMILPLVGYTDPATGAPMSNHIGWQPWADPTHVNYWWFPEALLYFCEGPFKANADYGIRTWAPLGPYIDPGIATHDGLTESPHSGQLPTSWWSVRDGWEGVARLVKP